MKRYETIATTPRPDNMTRRITSVKVGPADGECRSSSMSHAGFKTAGGCSANHDATISPSGKPKAKTVVTASDRPSANDALAAKTDMKAMPLGTRVNGRFLTMMDFEWSRKNTTVP